MAILEFPDEILYYLLTYVEDIDLQTLTITCKRLRSIALDGPLRRHILLKRTPARLNSYLSTRPSRDTLVTKNILRGVHIQQHIRQGQYIGGDSAVRSYNILCRLERQMVSIKISRKLRARPDWHELVERRLIPEEMFFNQDEYDARRKWMTYQQQQKRLKLGSFSSSPSRSSLTYIPYLQDQRDPPYCGEAQDKEGIHPIDTDTPRDHGAHNSNNLKNHDLTSELEGDITLDNPLAPLFPSPPPRKRQRKAISMLLVPKIELLRKAMDRDRLSRLVQKRPSPSELNQSPGTATVLHAYHLIAFSTTSPDLVPLTSQLSFLLKGERLRHWLCRRPSLAVILNERNILKTEVRTAWMVCPGVGQKVRFYENLIQERRDYDQRQRAQQQIRCHPHCHCPSLEDSFHFQPPLSPTVAVS